MPSVRIGSMDATALVAMASAGTIKAVPPASRRVRMRIISIFPNFPLRRDRRRRPEFAFIFI